MQNTGAATFANLAEAAETQVQVAYVVCLRLWEYNIECALRAYVLLSAIGLSSGVTLDCECLIASEQEDPFLPFYERLETPSRHRGYKSSSKRGLSRPVPSKNDQLSMFNLATWANSTSPATSPELTSGGTPCASQDALTPPLCEPEAARAL